uniref:Regulatory protein zeste n=1 Tax=Plectus sambesii TaxID=2011161 RepID=A0A914X6E3_9BILA
MRKIKDVQEKIDFVRKMLENKAVIFGSLSPLLTAKDKEKTWRRIRDELLALGSNLAAANEWKALSNTVWQNIRRSTINKIDARKRTGGPGPIETDQISNWTELDSLVYDLLGRSIISGLDVPESGESERPAQFLSHATSDESRLDGEFDRHDRQHSHDESRAEDYNGGNGRNDGGNGRYDGGSGRNDGGNGRYGGGNGRYDGGSDRYDDYEAGASLEATPKTPTPKPQPPTQKRKAATPLPKLRRLPQASKSGFIELVNERKLAKTDLEIEYLKLQIEAQKMQNRKMQLELYQLEDNFSAANAIDDDPLTVTVSDSEL